MPFEMYCLQIIAIVSLQKPLHQPRRVLCVSPRTTTPLQPGPQNSPGNGVADWMPLLPRGMVRSPLQWPARISPPLAWLWPRGAHSRFFSAFPFSCYKGALSGTDSRKFPFLVSLALTVMNLLFIDADVLFHYNVVWHLKFPEESRNQVHKMTV